VSGASRHRQSPAIGQRLAPLSRWPGAAPGLPPPLHLVDQQHEETVLEQRLEFRQRSDAASSSCAARIRRLIRKPRSVDLSHEPCPHATKGARTSASLAASGIFDFSRQSAWRSLVCRGFFGPRVGIWQTRVRIAQPSLKAHGDPLDRRTFVRHLVALRTEASRADTICRDAERGDPRRRDAKLLSRENGFPRPQRRAAIAELSASFAIGRLKGVGRRTSPYCTRQRMHRLQPFGELARSSSSESGCAKGPNSAPDDFRSAPLCKPAVSRQHH